MKKFLIIFVIFFIVVMTAVVVVALNNSGSTGKPAPVTLKYWRVIDEAEKFDEIIAQYQKLHPNVTIDYRKFRQEEFEKMLIEAMAIDQGPDIFSIHNTWMQKYVRKGLIVPLPPKTTMIGKTQEGLVRKETVYKKISQPSLTVADIKNQFIDTVYRDVVIQSVGAMNQEIYGLPMAVDTLALFYNKDLLNNASIAKPAATWDEVNQQVPRLVKFNAKEEIIQAGINLGGSKNSERSTDILSVLMLQSGAEMIDVNGMISFNRVPRTLQNQNYNPGVEALSYYRDFANIGKDVYTWNPELNSAVDMFVNGRLAMLIGYSYLLPQIKERAPRLNFGIAPLPQLASGDKNSEYQKTNFANYWIETVSVKTQFKDEAWDFLQYATREENVKNYLDKTGKPTALRSLYDAQRSDEQISVFAEALLTAKTWYRGLDIESTERAFTEMIDEARTADTDSLDKIIGNTAQKVQQTMNYD